MKRHGIAAAIAIVIIAFIGIGFVMIIFDQLFQQFTATGTQLCSVGCYDSGVLSFFTTGWFWWPFIGSLVPLSIWLYQRAQESAQGIE